MSRRVENEMGSMFQIAFRMCSDQEIMVKMENDVYRVLNPGCNYIRITDRPIKIYALSR